MHLFWGQPSEVKRCFFGDWSVAAMIRPFRDFQIKKLHWRSQVLPAKFMVETQDGFKSIDLGELGDLEPAATDGGAGHFCVFVATCLICYWWMYHVYTDSKAIKKGFFHR